jgi:hypothetical protein
MAEAATCLDCGMVNPPPEMTCNGGRTGATLRDHFVGDDKGCPSCGRLVAACALRPCQEVRAARYGAEDDGSDEGETPDD